MHSLVGLVFSYSSFVFPLPPSLSSGTIIIHNSDIRRYTGVDRRFLNEMTIYGLFLDYLWTIYGLFQLTIYGLFNFGRNNFLSNEDVRVIKGYF